MKIISPFLYLFLSALISIFLPQSTLGQQQAEPYCGTQGFAPHLLPKHACQAHAQSRRGQDKIFLLKYYIIQDDNGQGGAGFDAQTRRALAETNQYFQGTGIQFALCGSPIYIDSSDIRYLNASFLDWAYQISDPRYFNVFENRIFPSLAIPSTAYASFPGTSNRIVSFNGGGMTGRVLAHELGHNLGLLHTFGPGVGFSITDEWVNGGNCTTAGDRICDTPADPYRYGVNTTCGYSDTVLRDVNGDIYSPDITNIMCYFPCRTDHFTQGQADYMNAIHEQDRFYLHTVDSSQFARLEGVPDLVCVGENIRTQLRGYPAGGTFSGPGVQGDSLVIGGLAPGHYRVTYFPPPKTAVPAYTKIDASQSMYGHTPYQGDSLWLGFRARENAPLDAIRVRLRADTTLLLRWQLLDGLGSSGNQLYAQVDTIPADSMMRWYRFEINQTISQQACQVYSLSFGATDSFYWEVAYSFASYPQEPSSLSDPLNPLANRMPCFATEITSIEMLCHSDSISYEFSVIEPAASLWEPEDRFCVEQDALILSSFHLFDISLFYSDITYCLLYTSPSPRDRTRSRMPSSA